MKKIFLFISPLLLFAFCISGCNRHNGWNAQQREELHNALKNYREMTYRNHLTPAEYDAFADEVARLIEEEYPVFTSFIQMQGVADTLDVVVVETIAQELDEDAHNLRHIYPYNFLVDEVFFRRDSPTISNSNSTNVWQGR